MAVLDAWAYGLPVVATPVGGLKDILKHGQNALVFIPGDLKRLADILDRLIMDSQLREKLSEASISLSEGPFNIEIISEKIGNLYARVCNKHGPSF